MSGSRKSGLVWCIALIMSVGLAYGNVNVLIIGSTTDSPRAGSKSDPFPATEIRNQLNSILTGAGLGTVNVTLLNRDSGTYSLAQWFHYPSPANVETSTRWPNLRGATTPWDYVILIGDPYTMEYMPGLYAQGVAAVGQEVAKGTNGAETILLMPWPASGSSSSVDHYKEVVYRAGRTGEYKVAPAAIAWEEDGSNRDGTHPSARGAYICAASIYSAIWGKSATNSTYNYDAALADAVNAAVVTNTGAVQYTGKSSFQNPFLMLGDPRRDVHHSEKGTSTEADYIASSERAMGRCRVSYNSASYRDKYSSNTPEDDGRGWPMGNPMPIAWNQGRYNPVSEPEKEYVLNTNYWQLGMGFRYQYNTYNDPVDTANDSTLGRMYSEDLYLADLMLSQDNSARLIPWRFIWALIHQEYPALKPLRDSSGPHVNTDLREAVGTYMYTLYSGRCPLDPEPSTMTTLWFAQKVGYETAWRLGTGSTRAPGFKVMPTSATATNVTPTTTETMTVQFIFPPKSDVTVNISVSNANAASLNKASMTFTPANYNVAQSVVITGLDGALATEDFNVVFNTASSDEAYNNLNDSWKYSVNRPVASTVTYNANTADSGSVPVDATAYSANDTVTVLGNTGNLVKAGHTFIGWNTNANGGGTGYTEGSTFTIIANTILYAQWSSAPVYSLTVTNGSGDGSYPEGANVSITADEPPAGERFASWTTSSGGSFANADSAITTYTMPANDAFVTANYMPNNPPVVAAGADRTIALSNGGPWTPSEIDTYSWYDASAVSTITASEGSVSKLENKSGDFRHMSQSDPLKQPKSGIRTMNGLNVLDFDYTATQMMLVSGGATGQPANTIMIAVAAHDTDLANRDGILNFQDRVGLQVDMIYTGVGKSTRVADSYVTYANQSGAFMTAGVLNWDPSAALPASYVRGFVNGAQAGSDVAYIIPFTSGGNYAIMSENNTASTLDGAFAEAIVTSGDNSTDTRQKLEGYLAHKWFGAGANNALPADHPYKDFSPGAPRVSVTLTDASITDADTIDTPTATWTVVSKVPYDAAEPTFDDVTQVNATATFTTAGTYVLRLTADDGYGPVYAEVTITVGAASEVTVNHSVPHSWLASIDPNWTNDYEAAAMNDPDGDGFSTWEEYWSGTDPLNAESHLKIDDVRYIGSNVELEWRHAEIAASIPDILIQASTNLAAGNWSTVGTKTPVNGTNAWLDVYTPPVYFRLVAPNAP